MAGPFQEMANETDRDDRFIAYSNGTVLDTQTGLMWAARDNGWGINWHDAKSYCGNYRGGGYTDWRMPKLHELVGIYDNDIEENGHSNCVTDLIEITDVCMWASYKHVSEAAVFYFSDGARHKYTATSLGFLCRALPVRSGNIAISPRKRKRFLSWNIVRPVAAEVFNLWVDNTQELRWAREAWGILRREGLTSYYDDLTRCKVALCFIALCDIYRDFAHIAWHESVSTEYYDLAGKLDIDSFQLESLLEENEETESIEEIEPRSLNKYDKDDLRYLSNDHRPEVIEALMKGHGGDVSDLFFSLWITNPNHSDETNDFIGNADLSGDKLDAYSWLASGCETFSGWR